jgi:protein-S-isoprenylcysteine O-methyltransferase Ste14
VADFAGSDRIVVDYLAEEVPRARVQIVATETEIAQLHRRASEWIAAHELPAEAISHVIAAGAFDRAVGLLQYLWTDGLSAGLAQLAAANDWLATLPVGLVASSPALCFVRHRAAVFFLALPGTVLFHAPMEIAAAGLVCPDLSMALGALAVLAWVVVAFATRGKGTAAPNAPTTELVQSGLYRFSRNPMYVGGLLIGLGYPLSFQSLGLVFYWFAVLLFFHMVLVVHEEPSLEQRFGLAWTAYRRRVPRWPIAGGRS